MAGAFLLPALSPEDGIPVVQAGSCSAALHCDEFSTDVFLLLLLSTLPVLLFSPARLQPWCSRFLNTSIAFMLLFFSILLLALCVLLLSVFSSRVCTHLTILHVPSLFLWPNYDCGCAPNDINSCSESWKFESFAGRLWINTSGNQLSLFDLAKSKHKSTVIEPYASNRLSKIVLLHVIVMDHSLNQELCSRYEAKSKRT